MLKHFRPDETPQALQNLIDKLEDEMDNTDVNSDEFAQLMTKMERLYKIKANERPESYSQDTLLMVLGNLAGILMIVAYEQKHVVTSKGLTQLIRLKALG